MNSMKRQKNMTPEDGSLRSEGEGRGHILIASERINHGESRRQIIIALERINQLGQSGNDNQLWICL